LGILGFLGWQGGNWKVPIVNRTIISTGILLGTLTEILQTYVPFRNPDIYDWLADFLGIVVGVWVIGHVKKN